MTFTAMRPDLGLGNGREVSLFRVAATVAAVAVAEHDMERTEILYRRGDISARERGERHGGTIGSTTMGGGGAVAGALIGAPLGPLGSFGGALVGGAAGGAGGAKLGEATLGRSLGNMYAAEESRVADASTDFFHAAGPLTLPQQAYLGIGLSPATEKALVGGQDAKENDR